MRHSYGAEKEAETCVAKNQDHLEPKKGSNACFSENWNDQDRSLETYSMTIGWIGTPAANAPLLKPTRKFWFVVPPSGKRQIGLNPIESDPSSNDHAWIVDPFQHFLQNILLILSVCSIDEDSLCCWGNDSKEGNIFDKVCSNHGRNELVKDEHGIQKRAMVQHYHPGFRIKSLSQPWAVSIKRLSNPFSLDVVESTEKQHSSRKKHHSIEHSLPRSRQRLGIISSL